MLLWSIENFTDPIPKFFSFLVVFINFALLKLLCHLG